MNQNGNLKIPENGSEFSNGNLIYLVGKGKLEPTIANTKRPKQLKVLF